MIDFHSHSQYSDGWFCLGEHTRRAYVAGYKTMGITDHVDFSSMEHIYTSLIRFCEDMKDCDWDFEILPGVEITHVPAKLIEKLVQKGRDLKIPLIIVHGESPAEPVEKGTNRAAIEAQVDILAHPGLITEEDVKRAVALDVSLELTSRGGHSLTNGHVAKLAFKHNAPLVLNSDMHTSNDFLTPELRNKVMRGAGLDDEQIKAVEANILKVYDKIKKRI